MAACTTWAAWCQGLLSGDGGNKGRKGGQLEQGHDECDIAHRAVA